MSPRRRPIAAAPSPEAFQAKVAEILRSVRKERGWTLEGLAQRSGVSRAMLSQIEARKANPTIAVLWKISTAFGLNFSALLGEEGSQDVTLVRRAEIQVLRSADGKFESRPLYPRGVNRKAELYELRLASGGRSEGPPHPPGTRENLVVVRGCLTIEVGDKCYPVGEGDAIEFAADVPHVYQNPGPGLFLGYEVIEYR